MTREDYVFRGKKFSRFYEGDRVYVYSHETGNMNMRRPEQWRALAVMDRQPSRPKGARPGVANNPDHAHAIAQTHSKNYRRRGS